MVQKPIQIILVDINERKKESSFTFLITLHMKDPPVSSKLEGLLHIAKISRAVVKGGVTARKSAVQISYENYSETHK